MSAKLNLWNARGPNRLRGMLNIKNAKLLELNTPNRIPNSRKHSRVVGIAL